jgi:hypothetical protein
VTAADSGKLGPQDPTGATDLGQTSLGLLNVARAKMRDLLPEESHVTVKGKALGLHHSHTQAKLNFEPKNMIIVKDQRTKRFTE